MRLRELEPQFLRREGGGICAHVDTVDEADGVRFLCPTCFTKNVGPVGTHGIICWRPRVPADVDPKPGRWEFLGTGYDDLTLRAGSSSILLQGPGCGAHFYIENGSIRMC